MPVEAIDETGRYPHARKLATVLEALLGEVGRQEADVTLVVVDDASISALNERDRGVSGPTDVLSYPTHEPTDVGFPQVQHLGDVLVSLDTAERQAHEAGHPLEVEMVTLAAHGLTHLLGHDHETEAAWGPFRKAQDRAVTLLGEGGQGVEERWR